AWIADMLIEYGQAYSAGWGDFTTSDYQGVVGHSPRDVADFIRDHAAAFTSADDACNRAEPPVVGTPLATSDRFDTPRRRKEPPCRSKNCCPRSCWRHSGSAQSGMTGTMPSSPRTWPTCKRSGTCACWCRKRSAAWGSVSPR